MASGTQLSEQNVKTFAAWVTSKTDDDFRALASRGVLSRTEIAKECGFAKSALLQNPRIKDALKVLEDSLRTRNVFPAAVATSAEDTRRSLVREPGKLRNALDAERLRRFETDYACLKAENTELKIENAELKRTLQKRTFLSEALAQTGRVPR